jgi:internalin A
MCGLARQLIAENKSSKDTFLDLGNCGLNEIPAEVSDLVWLERLSLAHRCFKWDGQHWQHIGKSRNFGDRNRLSHLGPLAALTGLRELYLSGTLVPDLAPLADLAGLQKLDLSKTQVTDLAPLVGLRCLQWLDVSNTKVTDLAPLIALLRGGLPVKSYLSRVQGNGISVEDCPLTNPPPEIAAQGNEAILNYFAERQGGVDHLYEAKMLIVGEGGAGKTSLLTRLYSPDEPLPTEGDSTKGIKIHKHEFKLRNGRTFRLNVWDFGGQEIYHATHQFFLTHRSLYVLLDDTRKDYKSVSDEGFEYWLELIEVFGGRSPILIFQNEKSGRSKAIDFSGIRQHYDNVKELYADNLERRDAADKVRDGIEFYAANLRHIGDELPARWLTVREDIEGLAAKHPYIPVEKYFEVYGKHVEFDETKALLLSRYFHDLGVFLHFQDDLLLKRTVILQNEWATEAVFRILDDEVIKKRLGRFSDEDCARLWKDSAYARMHPELLALMQNFELCYELRDTQPKTWLAPQLLPPTKPEDLGEWAKPEDLMLRYKYEFLPKGMISRLTVRLHRFVKDPAKAWVTGVLFEHDKTAALAEILPLGNEIELRARGPEHKALLSVIAADLDALNESFKGLRDKVDKLVPCNCNVCTVEPRPYLFSQNSLLRRKEHGRMKVECGRNYDEVDVLELLDGIKMEKPPVWAKDDSGDGSKPPAGTSRRTVRIFLASSNELSKERDELDRYLRTRNDRLIQQGLYLQIVRWEDFLDAMSKTRLQDEYNKAIRDCDVFIGLFFTKVGKFTEEEFDVALRAFKEKSKPRIFTFFKKAHVDIDSLPEEDFKSLRAFHQKLRDIGHFYTPYENIEDLKLKFRDQLDMLIEQTHA